MAESPDREVIFRREGNVNTEYEDANETLEEAAPRDRNQSQGGGDFGREGFYRDLFDNYRNTRGPNAITVKPEPYDGSDDWEEYITQFEVCAELGKWRDIDMALTLASALRGPARTFYISLPQMERRNYGILVQRLGARFGSAKQDSRWLSRLETRKRAQGESIAALAENLSQMAQRAYREFDARAQGAQEVLALNQLYKSVSPDVKYQCRDCRTISEAVEVIERFESIMIDSTGKRKSTRIVAAEGTEQELGTIESLSRRMEKLETDRKMTPHANDRRYGTQDYQYGQGNNFTGKNRRRCRCYICKSKYHFFSKCPTYIKCMTEMKGLSYSNGSKDKDTERNAIGKNQGNFNSSLTN